MQDDKTKHSLSRPLWPKGSSEVIRFFAGWREQKGQGYLREGIPPDWRPELVFASWIDQIEFESRFMTVLIFRLNRFHWRATAGEPFTAELDGPLVRWLTKLDARVTSGSADVLAPEGGVCRYKYQIGNSRGLFQVSIHSVNKLGASLVATIDETLGGR